MNAQQIAAEAAEKWLGEPSHPMSTNESRFHDKQRDELTAIIQAAIEKANPLCASHRAGVNLSGSNECPLCRTAHASEREWRQPPNVGRKPMTSREFWDGNYNEP